MIRVTNVKLKLDDALTYEKEIESLRRIILSSYKVKLDQLQDLIIYKKAIDARRKNNVHFVYTIDIVIKNENSYLLKNIKNTSIAPKTEYIDVAKGDKKLTHRPIIVGFGPSGVFAALILSRRGYNPIVLERGLDVDNRTKEWDDFLETGKFKENSSILYGEGGAGTFSDGKLTTNVKNIRSRFVLQELIKAGAQKEIMYVNKPHIGTDVLKTVMKNIRQEIIKNGGDVRFQSKVTDFEVKNNKLQAVIVNGEERILTELCLLGIGHSARDTFEVLLDNGVDMKQKPFSVGVRIEHKQEMINKSQYGSFHDHPALGAAEYKLNFHSKSGRSAYTFCMCPGGFVVNSTSENNTVVTNGMSYSKRDGENANSALLINVSPEDFEGDHPLAGIKFQQQFERKAFELAGSNYRNPIQLVGDFLKDKNSTHTGIVTPTIKPGFTFVKMQDIYPKYITETMKEALQFFDNRIQGFATPDAVLTGPETRSSSPVRFYRDEFHQTNITGLYPMGEGPGYAGGIMTAAIDGIKTAEEIIKKYY